MNAFIRHCCTVGAIVCTVYLLGLLFAWARIMYQLTHGGY